MKIRTSALFYPSVRDYRETGVYIMYRKPLEENNLLVIKYDLKCDFLLIENLSHFIFAILAADLVHTR